MADRKTKLKVVNKLLNAGYNDEKAILGFGIRDMQISGIRSDEIAIVIELQEATKNHKGISFLADEIKKKDEGGKKYEE